MKKLGLSQVFSTLIEIQDTLALAVRQDKGLDILETRKMLQKTNSAIQILRQRLNELRRQLEAL